MKDKKKVAELIAQLKAEVETPYELAAIERLEKELIDGAPKVETIDEDHKKFNGMLFHNTGTGHYICSLGLHKAVWTYYFGAVFDGYDVHHKNEDKENNLIENLQALTAEDHMRIHVNHLWSRSKTILICENCGEEYLAINLERNKYCEKCRKLTKRNYKKDPPKEKRICAWCGKEFVTSRFRHSKCCSKSCGIKFSKKDSPHKETVICEYCGKEFTAYKSQKKKCCSRQCATKNYYKKKKEVQK